MGYRIEYESDIQNSKQSRFPWAMATGFFVAFLWVVNHYWPQGKHILQKLLWPGDWDSLSKAVDIFVQQLRWGEPVAEAATAFCREIIHGY